MIGKVDVTHFAGLRPGDTRERVDGLMAQWVSSWKLTEAMPMRQLQSSLKRASTATSSPLISSAKPPDHL